MAGHAGEWTRQRSSFVAGRAAIEADPACAGSLSAFTVKFFADGVIEAGTGFMLEPYDDAPHSCGLPNWSPAELAEAVAAFDDTAGRIDVGAPADFCLVGADITARSGLEVGGVPVLGTWVGGRQVFGG